MKLKKAFFDFCYFSTVITLLSLIIALYFKEIEAVKQILFNSKVVIIRGIFTLLFFILLIKCIVEWSRNDKRIIRFILLLFLTGFYLIYYYPWIRKQNWI